MNIARNSSAIAELIRRAGRVRQLSIERLAIPDAPAQKLRPLGYAGKRIAFSGQQSPQFRMMPTELVPGTVAVFANSGAQPLHLGNQLFSIQVVEIFIHDVMLHLEPRPRGSRRASPPPSPAAGPGRNQIYWRRDPLIRAASALDSSAARFCDICRPWRSTGY